MKIRRINKMVAAIAMVLVMALNLIGCGSTTRISDEDVETIEKMMEDPETAESIEKMLEDPETAEKVEKILEGTEGLDDIKKMLESTEAPVESSSESTTETGGKDNSAVNTNKPAETPKPTAKPATESTEKPETPQSTATPEPTAPPHTHDYTESVTKQPTCAEDGVKTLTCSCGDVKTEAIPATGHDFVTQYQTLTHEALGHIETTMVQTGTTKRTEYACAVCDARFDTAAGVQEHCKGTGDFDHAMARTIAYDYEEPVYEETSTWVVDSPAWEEQVPVGTICSKCGVAGQ